MEKWRKDRRSLERLATNGGWFWPMLVAGGLAVGAVAANIPSQSTQPLKPEVAEPRREAPVLNPKEGRAQCVANIRTVQQVLRVFQNKNGIRPGDAGLRKALLIGPKCLLKKDPTCPSGGKYTWAKDRFPRVGELMLRCSHADHVPVDHKDW